jgi:hypothetical protein
MNSLKHISNRILVIHIVAVILYKNTRSYYVVQLQSILNRNLLTMYKLVLKKKSMENLIQSCCAEAEGRYNRDSSIIIIIIIISIQVMRYT